MEKTNKLVVASMFEPKRMLTIKKYKRPSFKLTINKTDEIKITKI